jgi:protein-disulfide isomerase
MIRTGRERKARRKIKALRALFAKNKMVEKNERVKKNQLLASKNGIKATPVNFFEDVSTASGRVVKMDSDFAKRTYQGGRVSLADLAREGYPLKRE